MSDQIFILVLAVTLAFLFGWWIGNDHARRQMKRKRRQDQIDELIILRAARGY